MSISEPRLRSLLRRAEKVAAAGKRAAAAKLYRQIIEESPQAEAAWLGLAEMVTDPAEKEAAWARVLALDPDNQAAQAGLARLRGELSPETAEPATGAMAADDPFNQSRDWLNAVTARQDQPANPGTAVAKTAPALPAVADDDQHSHVVTTGEAAAAETYDLFCYRHPDRSTSLRCYSCGKPICGRCAQHTPVGYRCPQCIREAEEVFFTARALDYVIAFVVTLPLSVLAGYFVPRLGFFIIFVGALVGTFIGNIVWRLVGRRRGRWLPHLVAATVIVGGLPAFLFYGFLWPGVYLFLTASAAYYRMR